METIHPFIIFSEKLLPWQKDLLWEAAPPSSGGQNLLGPYHPMNPMKATILPYTLHKEA